eukprot:1158757-Pelagomonas_calceolata.AAC.11
MSYYNTHTNGHARACPNTHLGCPGMAGVGQGHEMAPQPRTTRRWASPGVQRPRTQPGQGPPQCARVHCGASAVASPRFLGAGLNA